MSDPFIGEIRPFAFDFAPIDWAFCSGQQVPYQQYIALYSILGATFGPTDGKSYFTLPNLAGRTPMGSSYDASNRVGTRQGEDSVALTPAQTAPHVHTAQGGQPITGQTTATPSSNSLLSRISTGTVNYWGWSKQESPTGTMAAAMLSAACGNTTGMVTPHENRQPYLTINFCICLDGIYPVHD